jgi:glycosyltransferase involved in cell wall biosynthesis
MNILHISRSSSMVRQFFLPMLRAQKDQGHRVLICGSEDEDAQFLRDQGFDVYPHRLTRSLNPINLINAIRRVKKLLRELEIEIVICHSPIGAGVGRLAAKLARTPKIIYFAHGLPCAPAQNRLTWLFWLTLEKILGRITDALIVMNDYDEQLARKHKLINNPDKIFRISGMGVDLDKFPATSDPNLRSRIEDEFHLTADHKIILCVAHLFRRKGIFEYLDAARQIIAQRNDVCFLLAGRGPRYNELQNRIQTFHLHEHFKLLGWRLDVHRLMQAADLFVLPTYYFEGLPVAILEAMACAKPVIATRHRGCQDIVVPNQNGYLVPVKQIPPLVESIKVLLDDEPLRRKLGLNARRRVENHFALPHCTLQILHVLQQLLP